MHPRDLQSTHYVMSTILQKNVRLQKGRREVFSNGEPVELLAKPEGLYLSPRNQVTSKIVSDEDSLVRCNNSHPCKEGPYPCQK